MITTRAAIKPIILRIRIITSFFILLFDVERLILNQGRAEALRDNYLNP